MGEERQHLSKSLQRVLTGGHWYLQSDWPNGYQMHIHLPAWCWYLPFGIMVLSRNWYTLTKQIETDDYTTALALSTNQLVDLFGIPEYTLIPRMESHG